MKNNQWRIAMILMVLALILSLFAGCKGEPAGPGSKVDLKDFGGRTIRMLSWYDLEPHQGNSENEDARYEQYKALEDKYNFKFEYSTLPYYNMMPAYITSVAAGDPIADIIVISVRSFYPALVSKGMMLPLSDFKNFDFKSVKWNPLSIKLGTYNDKIYGCGIERRAGCLMYWNKSLFERENLPNLYDLQKSGEWTWDKMKEIAVKATKKNTEGKTTQYGLGGEFYPQYQFVYSNDASFVDFDTVTQPTFALNSQNGLDALQYIQDLKVDLGVWQPPTTGWDAAYNVFAQGNLAMCVGEYWVPGVYNFTEMTDEWGTVMFPKGPKADDYVSVIADMGLFTIPANTAAPEQVAIVLDEILDPTEGQDYNTSWKDNLEYLFSDKDTVDTFELVMDNRTVFTSIELFHDTVAQLYMQFMAPIEAGTKTPKAVMDEYAPKAQQQLNDVFAIANGQALQNINTGDVKYVTFESLAWIASEVTAVKDIIMQWNLDNPNIQVEYVQGNWGTIEQRAVSGFTTGVTSDIFHYRADFVNTWKNTGHLADLSSIFTEEDKKDFSPDILALMTAKNGEITGIPFEYEIDMTYYNKKMFADAGIKAPTFDAPWTFEQFIDAAKRLTDESKGVYGLGVAGYNTPMTYFNDLWSNKTAQGLVYKGSTGYQIKVSDQLKQVMEGYKNLLADKCMPENVAGSFDWMGSFKSGKTAMLTGAGCWSRTFLENDTSVEWGILPPVKMDNMNTYGPIQTVSVPAIARNKKEAIEFLKYFCNAENQAKIAAAAYQMPGRISSLKDPVFSSDTMEWKTATKLGKLIKVPTYINLPTWSLYSLMVGNTLYSQYVNGTLDIDQFTTNLETSAMKTLRQIRQ